MATHNGHRMKKKRITVHAKYTYCVILYIGSCPRDFNISSESISSWTQYMNVGPTPILRERWLYNDTQACSRCRCSYVVCGNAYLSASTLSLCLSYAHHSHAPGNHKELSLKVPCVSVRQNILRTVRSTCSMKLLKLSFSTPPLFFAFSRTFKFHLFYLT